MKRRTGFVWHEAYAWFDLGNDAGMIRPDFKAVQPDRHAYDPETVRRIRNLLEVSGLLDDLVSLKPRSATEAEIRRVHTQDHVDEIKRLSALDRGGETGVFMPIVPGTYDIALLAAGGAITAADAVVDAKVDNAYALLRPAGHHSMPHQSMGFCVFSNAAIAGRHLLEARGLERIAYVDWDVHHGNGTQAAFYTEPRALTISIHQSRHFPSDDGFIEQTGEGPGEGANINVPLPPGCGVATYCEVYDRVVIPALEAFQPDCIIVPSGFDAGALDPLGRMMMHSDGYRQLTRKLLDVADKLCDGRLVFTHEGGYSTYSVPFYGLAVMEELSGVKTDVVDPFLDWVKNFEGQDDIQAHQTAIIDQAAAQVARIPSPDLAQAG